VKVVVNEITPNEFARMYASMRVIESWALARDCGSTVGESA
jgi:hypothetical protein